MGDIRVERQCAVGFWKKRLPATKWADVHGTHNRTETGGGYWTFHRDVPDQWLTRVGPLVMKTKLTSFGHLGFFVEQSHQWDWFRSNVADLIATRRPAEKPKFLNLFAYTGGSSLSLALGGAHVTHVDAAKGVVDWARENAQINRVPENSVRFIVEDCLTFLKREERRGNKYHGVLLDPPSYGRGPNKEIFKIESDIGALLDACVAVLEPEPWVFHLSCHSPGFTPEVLKNLVSERIGTAGFRIEQGEMTVTESESGRLVPSGAFARFRRT